MVVEQHSSHPSPPYSKPLEELGPPQSDGVRVKFPCPYCGEVLERVAKLDETRWYLPTCSAGHSGIGVRDPTVERLRARTK